MLLGAVEKKGKFRNEKSHCDLKKNVNHVTKAPPSEMFLLVEWWQPSGSPLATGASLWMVQMLLLLLVRSCK